MKASRGTGRFGPKILQKAILAFYAQHKLLPKGMTQEMAAVDLWSLKMGRALSRLVACLNNKCLFNICFQQYPYPRFPAGASIWPPKVSRFRRLMQLASSSKNQKIDELKRSLAGLCATRPNTHVVWKRNWYFFVYFQIANGGCV